ncbi:MAG: hypothetical protein U0T83_09470 [Bacteriovoracaceae bacterium]
MLTNISYFLTILLLIWILILLFRQFIYPLKQFKNVLIAAIYIYMGLMLYFIALEYPEFKLPEKPLLLFFMGSLLALVGLSLLKNKSYPQQARVWLKTPILFFMVGYLMARSNYYNEISLLTALLYLALFLLLIKNRALLRLPLRSFIFFTFFLVIYGGVDVPLVKFVSMPFGLYYLYQFTNHFLIKYYFEQKIHHV